jgi:hypothetical protein
MMVVLSRLYLAIILCSIVTIVFVLLYGEQLATKEHNAVISQKEAKIYPIISRFETDIFDIMSLMEITAKQEGVTSVPHAHEINELLHGIRDDQDPKKRSIARDILYNKKNLDTVFFALPNGDMYMIEPYQRQLAVTASNFAFRDWYGGVTSTQSTYVSELFFPQGKDDNSIAIVTPVRSESGELIGIWGTLMMLDVLAKQFDGINLNKNEHVLLVDHNGNLVIDSQQKSYKKIDSFLHLPSINLALNHNIGTISEKLNGHETFTIFAPIAVGTHTWALIITEPYSDAFSEVQLIRTYYVVTAVLIALGTALSVCLLQKHGSRPKPFILDDKIRQIEDGLDAPKTSIPKKQILAIFTVAVVLLVVFIYAQDLQSAPSEPPRTHFVIQNLRGDIIDTWMYWKIPENSIFHIHVARTHELTEHRMNIIHDVIYSDEILGPNEIDSDSVYYKGWYGAIRNLSSDTKLPIPLHFHSAITDTEDGHIVIRLSHLKDGDGYSGYTRLFVDEQNNQILKAIVTIYDVESLSDEKLAAILRHELGHAFGLAHSTDPNSLMYPEIVTQYPYISDCITRALLDLYDGKTKGQVVC